MSARPSAGAPAAFRLPERTELTLGNGLRATLVQYGAVPKASLRLSLRAGGLNEREGASGLAVLASRYLKEGRATSTRASWRRASPAAAGCSTRTAATTSRHSTCRCCPSPRPRRCGCSARSPPVRACRRASWSDCAPNCCASWPSPRRSRTCSRWSASTPRSTGTTPTPACCPRARTWRRSASRTCAASPARSSARRGRTSTLRAASTSMRPSRRCARPSRAGTPDRSR